jgi:NitT/TauT family transport system permease protein
MQVVIRESRILRWLNSYLRLYESERKRKRRAAFIVSESASSVRGLEVESEGGSEDSSIASGQASRFRQWMRERSGKKVRSVAFLRVLRWVMQLGIGVAVLWGVYGLFGILLSLGLSEWVLLLRNTFWTFCRVAMSLLLGTLWAVPVGIWIGMSSRRLRIFQPIIQVLASFPAPMLYPLVLAFLFKFKVSFDWASMALMLLGVQWYVLFNILAGALRIPRELGYALLLMETSRWDRWKTLYLPSVFPSLVTGWITAAGGAWNASILAEYLPYRGEVLETGGLGSTISMAVANQDFRMLAASLTVMVLVVVFLNRTVWAKIYQLAQTRYRLDL